MDEITFLFHSFFVLFPRKMFVCKKCDREFRYKYNLTKHLKKTGGNCTSKDLKTMPRRFSCDKCNKSFARKSTLQLHIKGAHNDKVEMYFCGLCPLFFQSKEEVKEHRLHFHRNRSKFALIESAHQNANQRYRLNLPSKFITNFSECLTYCQVKSSLLLEYLLIEKRNLKTNFTINLRFAKTGKTHETEEDGFLREEKEVMTFSITTNARVFMFGAKGDNEEKLANAFEDISNRYNDFASHGSGWALCDCLFFDVRIGQCMSLTGGCFQHDFKIDKYGKVSICESHETDGASSIRCFFSSIARYFLRKKYPKRMTFSASECDAFAEEHFVENISAPVNVDKIADFERENSHLDMAINVVFGDEEGFIYPCRPSSNLLAKNVIVLLLFQTHVSLFYETSSFYILFFV